MRILVFIVAGVLSAASAAAAAARATEPSCLTPAAADGHEPVCNPHLAGGPWAAPHRGSYAQGSSPLPAPRPGDEVRWQDLQYGNEIPVILQVSAPYPDGRRTVWHTTVSAPETKAVYKVDYATGEVIDRKSLADEGRGPEQTTTSGVYNLLDRDNRLITVRRGGFAVYGDERPGDSRSPIRLLHEFALPKRALCRDDDRIIGLTMSYTGEVVFATVQGMVGAVPRSPEGMRDEHLSVASINGARCSDPSVRTEDLEEVANSLAADEDGGVYVVSTKAQYRFDLRGGKLERAWRAEYATGGGESGSTLSSGSGSTPDLVGTDPKDDKLVVITDGQRLMHLVFFWRDEIPRGWKPIAPGKDRRIACEAPVRFGDPDAQSSVSEQSVLTRGHSAFVVNNALALDRVFTVLPPDRRPLSTLTSNVPGNGPRGMERIDWDPKTRTCRSVWANREVSIPNAVPTLSTESGLVYGMGVRDTVWGLEGLDMQTGKARLWVPTTPLPSENSFFAATTIGADGDVWIGGTSGISVFRGPERPVPEPVCKEFAPPRSTIRSVRRGVVRGTASDEGCGEVRSVRVTFTRRGARTIRRRARGTTSWRARAPRGHWTVRSQAVDGAGNLEPVRRGRRVVR